MHPRTCPGLLRGVLRVTAGGGGSSQSGLRSVVSGWKADVG